MNLYVANQKSMVPYLSGGFPRACLLPRLVGAGAARGPRRD